MALDIDLLAAGKPPLQLLGGNAGSTEPPDQLPTRFRTLGGTALIRQHGVGNSPEAPGDPEPAIGVRQRLRAIRQRVPETTKIPGFQRRAVRFELVRACRRMSRPRSPITPPRPPRRRRCMHRPLSVSAEKRASS